MSLDATFKVEVSKEVAAKLNSEMDSGKACLSITVPFGDGVEQMMSIYKDHLKTGDLKILTHENNFSHILIKGEVVRDLDANFDSDFIEALKKDGSLIVKCSDVCDNDVNSYYIDGNDEKVIEIGNCTLIN